MDTPIDLRIDFKSITQMLETAEKEDRQFLYEYEVYRLLSKSGAETPPQINFIPRGSRPFDDAINALPGDKAVLKIVSPYIIHKTEVGGVNIVPKETNAIRSAVRRMFYEVPENYAAWIERHMELAPEPYQGLAGDALISAVSRDIKGILQVQFMPPDSDGLGM